MTILPPVGESQGRWMLERGGRLTLIPVGRPVSQIEKCLEMPCRSPLACEGWGYCRLRNFTYGKVAQAPSAHCPSRLPERGTREGVREISANYSLTPFSP